MKEKMDEEMKEEMIFAGWINACEIIHTHYRAINQELAETRLTRVDFDRFEKLHKIEHFVIMSLRDYVLFDGFFNV